MRNQPILIIDDHLDNFAQQLQQALVEAGADALVAFDEAIAVNRLKQIDFAAVLIGGPPIFRRNLIDALGGVPLLFYGTAPDQFGRSLSKDLPTVLRALKEILGAV